MKPDEPKPWTATIGTTAVYPCSERGLLPKNPLLFAELPEGRSMHDLLASAERQAMQLCSPYELIVLDEAHGLGNKILLTRMLTVYQNTAEGPQVGFVAHDRDILYPDGETSSTWQKQFPGKALTLNVPSPSPESASLPIDILLARAALGSVSIQGGFLPVPQTGKLEMTIGESLCEEPLVQRIFGAHAYQAMESLTRDRVRGDTSWPGVKVLQLNFLPPNKIKLGDDQILLTASELWIREGPHVSVLELQLKNTSSAGFVRAHGTMTPIQFEKYKGQ